MIQFPHFAHWNDTTDVKVCCKDLMEWHVWSAWKSRCSIFDGYWRPLYHTPFYAQTLSSKATWTLNLTASSVFPLHLLVTVIVDINNNSNSPTIIVGLLHAMPCGGTFWILSSILIISSLQCRKLKLRAKKCLVQSGRVGIRTQVFFLWSICSF